MDLDITAAKLHRRDRPICYAFDGFPIPTAIEVVYTDGARITVDDWTDIELVFPFVFNDDDPSEERRQKCLPVAQRKRADRLRRVFPQTFSAHQSFTIGIGITAEGLRDVLSANHHEPVKLKVVFSLNEEQRIRFGNGRPYSHDAFPHLGAPGGPADAIDDPRVRKIWLQFASRLGKTFFGQCSVMKKADEQPGPMMFASSVEKTAIEVTERTYSMLERSPRVSSQLRPPDRRRQSCIDFSACQCHVAWSRSVSTLADKEVEFGHANEVDKWEHTATSKEADPLRLFMDRFKNRPHHKVIIESTPTVRSNSRIESGRLASSNCQYYVPCAHCERYQTLKLRSGPEGKERYHLNWDRLPGGKHDKDLARRTAWYECEHCKGRIEDHHRPWMMRLGVWCPEGCTVKDAAAKAAAESYLEAVRPRGGDGADAPLPEWHGWSSADWIEGTPHRDRPTRPARPGE